MKIDAATKALVDAWDAAWTAAQPTVTYVLDNEQYDEPNPPAPWVRFSIRHSPAGGQQMSQGRPARYRRRGILFVSLFSPVNQGRQSLDILTRSTIDALEAQTIGASTDCVTTYGASPRESPADAQWDMMTVTVPFDYWETK